MSSPSAPEGPPPPAAPPPYGPPQYVLPTAAPPTSAAASPEPPHAPATVRGRRRRPRTGVIVLGAALAVVVVAAGAGFLWLTMQLMDARSQIAEQEQRIDDQEREIEEQQELIDRKEQFGAAMGRLYDTIDRLVGLPYATLIPWAEYDELATTAWTNRWNAEALDVVVARADELTADLAARAATASAQAASNSSGTPWEAALDLLGGGWVSTAVDPGATACGAEALACVASGDPFVVRVAGRTAADPTLTDWIRTGAAYHEYAHVLQLTNPDATEPALAAFGGDYETMADCYALTFLDGWTLEHEVPIDEFSYWVVDVGYGYTCDDGQRQVIRDWVGGLGIVKQPVGG